MALTGLEEIGHDTGETHAKTKCGVIMPISSIGDYPESHWTDVYSIISDAVTDAGFEANLVSYADESTFIHKTIVQNLYDNPIVICDVSAKNPNVMFELGLRLAFDKPTIIVKDDATTYSFDTGAIEHLCYPKDLRFAKIVEFKEKLGDKVVATLKAGEDPDYSTFLKHFGKFTVAKLEEKEVSGQEYVIEELQAIRQTLASLNFQPIQTLRSPEETIFLVFPADEIDASTRSECRKLASRLPGVLFSSYRQIGGKVHFVFEIEKDSVAMTRPLLTAILDQAQAKVGFKKTAANPRKYGKSVQSPHDPS